MTNNRNRFIKESREARPFLILYDFDGTLTNCDTLPLFLRFGGGIRFYLCLPILVIFVILHKCKLMTAQKAKESLFSCLFKGYSQEKLHELGVLFSAKLIANKKKYFRSNALEHLIAERDKHSRVVIVSASLDIWIAPFATSFGVEHISTQLKYKDGHFTGKFLGKNCNGQEKAAQICAKIPNLQCYTIKAFGDSSGDLPMLDLAHKKYYRHFD